MVISIKFPLINQKVTRIKKEITHHEFSKDKFSKQTFIKRNLNRNQGLPTMKRY